MTDRVPHFIEQIVEHDLASGKRDTVRTRFPPEPNGYLHIGHAKSICLNFGLAAKYGGSCNLRFDDTNPVKEEQEYVDSIVRDVRWLGFRWPGASDGDPAAGVLFASDYFQKMYGYAVRLVEAGKAYVCDLTAEQIREHRGTLTEPGRPSPSRDRSVEQNLDLLERMREGEFPDGSRTLRAKIDMAHPNLNMRDPVMYRILHAAHHRTGSRWCIYPMYDWAHGLEDSIEGITHSICTLEFENHRPLYDWFLDQLGVHHPQQIEFARLNLNFTIMSKRKLLQLVREKHVAGWDDPRMPTISGLRRRGYTPESIRAFCDDVGVTRTDSVIDVVRLENAVRDHLNRVAPRRMAVLRPIKLTIINWDDPGTPPLRGGASSPHPEGGGQEGAGREPRVEWIDAVNNPEDPAAGTRRLPFCGRLYIEREDFMEDPPKKFFRLAPGAEVRLRYAYWVRCVDVVKDDSGEVVEVLCTYDPATRGGESPPDGRKVKATLHWVSAPHAVPATVRLFDRLFNVENPDRRPKDAPESWSFLESLNPASLEVVEGAMLEPGWDEGGGDPGDSSSGGSAPGGPAWPDGVRRYQFERHGYFCLDPETAPGRPVFNRTATLRDTWARVAARGG